MKPRTWIALLLSLCLVLLAGCAPKDPDETTGSELDEMEVLFGSMEDEPTPTPTPLEALYYDMTTKNYIHEM